MTAQTNKNHSQMLSFSDLIRATLTLLEKHFLELLFAIAVPMVISYIFFWTSLGLFVNDINTVTSYDDFIQLFKLGNRTFVFALVAIITVLFVDILAFIAAPLVLVKHKTITISTIFPSAIKYLGQYVWMIIIMGTIYLLLTILTYIAIFVAILVIGLFDISLVNTWAEALSNVMPTIIIALLTLFFMFSPYMLLNKDTNAWQAITGSIGLVKKHFWGLLIREAILLINLFVISFIIQFVPIVGYPLAALISSILVITYNYVLYNDIK